jgi:hypothetical protein
MYCTEWKTEKRQECTNMGKIQTTRIMKANERLVTSEAGLTKFQAA